MASFSDPSLRCEANDRARVLVSQPRESGLVGSAGLRLAYGRKVYVYKFIPPFLMASFLSNLARSFLSIPPLLQMAINTTTGAAGVATTG